ncbi:uncharacterized protein LOC122009095 isoform X1 [Zingiber officinale]|uniref:uncharacterized protein LOC122009095 isoform X1 n=2 Tax=Zingiber officinale TaxID=94328 RepID=UPI001C4D6848|nr:uncharacterized protein LOC122009095 isoform X1 [Zingiber officinale]XP_042421047.1 uncharacterized protein LOC122009095 isoform X1 [Zingiber officinale]XP_042421048.1 uncharacterized protein LOC122009095 isoform X1 [Zingiber officinale]
MATTAAGDTQVLDSDSPLCESQGGDVAADETQILLAETQTLQHDAAWSLDLYGKTQLVDAWGENSAVDDAGGETEALSQDEQGVSRDGANCSDRGDGVSGERTNGGWVDPDASTDDEPDGANGEGKEDTWVDPDASTDDEAGNSKLELMSEVKPCENNGCTLKMNNKVQKEESPYLLTSNYRVEALSYVGSHAPGNLTQANATEVVDNFLSIDCVESSQEGTNGETDTLNPVLVSGSTRAKIFAEKMCRGLPDGKANIFDWSDNLEVEGGCQFVCERRDSFSSIGREKQSHPPKSRCTGECIKRREMEGAASEVCKKVDRLVQSDSMMTAMKNIIKGMDEKSITIETHLETPNEDEGLQNQYVVGVDTQIAAEAMEALCHLKPFNMESKDAINPAEEILMENSRKNSNLKSASINIFLEKRVSTANLKSIKRISKTRKVLFVESRNVNLDSPTNLSNESGRSSRSRTIDNQLEEDAAFVHPKRRRTNKVASAKRNFKSIHRAKKIRSEEISDAQKNFPSGEVQASETPPKRKTASLAFVVQNPLTLCDKGMPTSLDSKELKSVVAPPTPVPKDFRRRKDMSSTRVLLSRHLDKGTIKQQKKILARFGLPLASSISDATHFVTDKFVRTQNMLEALAMGKAIVTPLWLESCGQASCFMDERIYILRDYKKEKEIGFNMSISLSHARQCPLLQGKMVFVTPNVEPSRELITSLAEASCGQVVETIGTAAMFRSGVMDSLLVISCEKDYSICFPLLQKGFDVYCSELLLNGLVLQKLEYGRHQLFKDNR